MLSANEIEKVRDRAERIKALTIWGALSGLGFAAGILLGGVITQFASW